MEVRVTICLPLLIENHETECWRPIETERVGTNTYHLVTFKPEDEDASCKMRRIHFADGKLLASGFTATETFIPVSGARFCYVPKKGRCWRGIIGFRSGA